MTAVNNESMSFLDMLKNGDVNDVERSYKDEYMNPSEKNMIPLHHACVHNCVDFVECMLQNNYDIEIQNNNQEKAIHLAVSEGFETILKLLIDKNCNIEAPNNNGERAIHLAASKGHASVLRLLLNHSCDVEAKDNNGERAIHHAALNGHTEILKILIDHYCEIEAPDDNGKRAIHIAAYNGQIGILEMLLDHNCNLEAVDNNERRAIHHATSNGQMHTLKLLLEHNCNIEAENQIGRRAIHYAAHIGHANILQILINDNCDINARTKDNHTPLHLTEKEHHEECKLIIKKALKERKERKDLESILMTGGIDQIAKVIKRYSPMKMVNFQTKAIILDVLMNRSDNQILDLLRTKFMSNEDINEFNEKKERQISPATSRRIHEWFLYRSIRYDNSSLFHFLCNPEVVNSETLFLGPSVLETVAKYGRVMYVKLVLSKLLRVDETWILALEVAKNKGFDRIAAIIGSRVKYINQQNEDGNDRLHVAVFDDDAEMIEYILENEHINGNYQYNNIGSAVSLAHFMKYDDCVAKFEDKKVKVIEEDRIEMVEEK